MPRTEPDAGPKLLLEDYGAASQRWLEAYASARDSYKQAAAAARAETGDSGIQFLLEKSASRTQRWLDRFEDENARIGPGRPASNLTASETPEPHLLLEDYAPGPRFVQYLGALIARSGAARKHLDHGASRVSQKPVDPSGANSALSTVDRAAGSLLTDTSRSRTRAGKVPQTPAAASAAVAEDDLPLDLTLHWEGDLNHARRRAQASSLAFHAAWIVLLLLQPYVAPPPPPAEETMQGMDRVTLLAPSSSMLAELTQRTPNQRDVTTVLEELTQPVRPSVVVPEQEPPREVIQAPDPPRIEPQAPPEPVPTTPAPEIAAEDPGRPAVADARSPAPGLTQPGQNRPRLRPQELPLLNTPERTEAKLEVEQPSATGLGRDGDLQLGSVRLNARPDEVIQAAVDNLAAGGGTQIVGDGYGADGRGGLLAPQSGNRGSTLELLSDPKGVDFRPYLIQVLAAVRRNWYAVIPESARLGMTRGRAAIQFIISRDGMVPKLVIANSSGVNSLDHAAVAGISASVPFQPLPIEYSGDEVRLQFVFLYNVRR
jgi:TonB family protein